MGQNVPLDKGETAIEPFFDAIQELLSAAAPNFHITLQADNVIRVGPATDANDQPAIAVGGKYRYRSSASVPAYAEATAAGTTGTYDIYVTASDNVFDGPPEDLDQNTVYDFSLSIRAQGSPPTGVDHYRKVGELYWDNTAGKITQIRQFVGSRNDTAPITPTAGQDGISPVRIKAATGQTADLLVVENSAGTELAAVEADGDITTSGGVTAGGALTGASISSASVTSTGNLTVQGNTQLGNAAADTVGFHGSAGTDQDTGYPGTINNLAAMVSTFDANNASIAEIADILGALIRDLKAKGLIAT